jgi:Family of unknown function (DUF6353)
MTMTALAAKTKLTLTQQAPNMLVAAGVVGFVATTVLTVRATLKAEPFVVRAHKRLDAILDTPVRSMSPEDKDEKLRLSGEVLRTDGVEIVRAYAPVVIVGGASLACFLTAHGIMIRRQAALVALYAALDTSYKAYRERVQKELGIERERDLYTGQAGKPPFDPDTPEGEDPIKDILPSPYARFFDATSVNWSKTPEYNMLFLRSQQQWANDRLRAHGFVFLNEVYESLGLERSQAGQMVGWKLEGDGDGFVDFGLYSIGDDNNRAFTNGVEAVVLLDFNVDGIIRI